MSLGLTISQTLGGHQKQSFKKMMSWISLKLKMVSEKDW